MSRPWHRCEFRAIDSRVREDPSLCRCRNVQHRSAIDHRFDDPPNIWSTKELQQLHERVCEVRMVCTPEVQVCEIMSPMTQTIAKYLN